MPPTPTRRPKEDQNLWNFLFSIFFVVVLIAALWEMNTVRHGYLISVPWFDALLMALATFRLTRLVVYDKITRWFRELFVQKRVVHHEGREMVEIIPFERGFRHTVSDLLACPWCISIWSALAVIFFYFIYPWAWAVILLLALSGVGSLVQLWANSIGWQAENRKMRAKEKEVMMSEKIDRSSLGK